MIGKLLIAAGAAVAFAGSAEADIVRLTLTGVVQLGNDPLDLFGDAGVDPTGQAFRAVFTYDTSLGNPLYEPDDPVVPVNDVQGGSYFGNASPLIGVRLSINHHSFTPASGYYDDLRSQNVAEPEGGSYIFAAAQRDNTSDGSIQGFFLHAAADPSAYPPEWMLWQNWSGDLPGNAYTSGIFYQGSYADGDYIQFTPTHLTIQNFGVPEPASWAMMVGGFGLVGAAMRRRRKVGLRFA